MFKYLLLFSGVISVLLLFRCSSPNSAPDPNLVTYRIVAVVDLAHDSDAVSFTAKIGDSLFGTVSYFKNTPDQYSFDSNQGFFLPAKPSGVSFDFNTLHFESDSNYNITIDVSDSSVAPTRDIFHLSAIDTKAAAELNLTRVVTTILFQDLTANTFSNDSLPFSLKLDDFYDCSMFLILTDELNSDHAIRLHVIQFTKI